ncbi:heme ABC transporter permease [Oleiphilus sp. HI0050]|nr:heme ABC transporter permease [Oleiphilus sp. HI0050]
MKWTFFHKLGSPKWFYDISKQYYPWFLIAALGLITAGVTWGLAFAPPDYQQGNSFRIIYLHVPSAILAQSCYMMMASAALVSLVWRMKIADIFISSAAPIGAAFTFLALFTGAVWGKPTWGTWWVWDARLTAMLILLFLYFGVISIQTAIEDANMAARASVITVLVGVVNIPIIKYSVEWWNTLHQPATFKLTEKPAMVPEMWIPLLVMVIGIYCFFAALVIIRMQNQILLRERKTRWVQDIVKQSGVR